MYERHIDNINYYMRFVSSGKVDTPVIFKDLNIDLESDIIPFNYASNIKRPRETLAVHFFIDDYQFKRIWERPLVYIEMLKDFKYILSPDFSLYTDYPRSYQIYNHFRNHAFSALAQSHGIKVVPTLSWSDRESFEWCFDGVERGSIVAISSVGAMKDKKSKELFIHGFKKAIEIVRPSKVLYFGVLPKELEKYEDILVYKPSYVDKHRPVLGVI